MNSRSCLWVALDALTFVFLMGLVFALLFMLSDPIR
jgi:hypothetical protein